MQDPARGAQTLVPGDAGSHLVGVRGDHLHTEGLRERHGCLRQLGQCCIGIGHAKFTMGGTVFGCRSRWTRCGYAFGVAFLDTAGRREELSPDRAWWLRVPAVLVDPRPVFFALREDDPDDVAARSEPILLVVGLAGAAAVLATPTAGGLLDNPEYDALLLSVWTFIAGSIYGAVGYFVLGFALFFGARLLGSLGSFRRERQLIGFAAVPLAVSFLLVLPLRLAIYGGDTFSEGGADEGTGEAALLGLQLVFVAWSLVLLLVGVKVVHGWSWPRSLGAVVAAAGLVAAIVGLFATI